TSDHTPGLLLFDRAKLCGKGGRNSTLRKVLQDPLRNPSRGWHAMCISLSKVRCPEGNRGEPGNWVGKLSAHRLGKEAINATLARARFARSAPRARRGPRGSCLDIRLVDR